MELIIDLLIGLMVIGIADAVCELIGFIELINKLSRKKTENDSGLRDPEERSDEGQGRERSD